MTLRRALFVTSLGLLLVLVSAGGAQERDWRETYRLSQAAHEQKDYARYRELIATLVDQLHGHAETLFGMVKAEALNGNAKEAEKWLRLYAQAGLSKNLAEEKDLDAIRTNRSFAELSRLVSANETPVSHSSLWRELPDDLVPEDITFDQESRRFYVTSIRHRKVIWIGEDGQTGDWLSEGQDGLWAALAIGIDPVRRILWVSTEAMPQAIGYTEADKNRSALRAYDLRTKQMLKHLEVSDRETAHELGDLAVMADGTVYVSDGKTGRLYRATADSSQLEMVSASFASPQGPIAFGPNSLLVADYVMGIVSIDLKSHAVTPLKHSLEFPLNGIDCLLRVGNTLVAIQNGVNPPRVVRFRVDSSATKITSMDVIERKSAHLGTPTHGVVRNGRVYYLANTGFENFSPDGAVIAGRQLSPARILYCDLK